MAPNKLLQWARPLDVVPFPNVWVEFEAKESKNSDTLVKYRIQDLPEDRFDDAVEHMVDNYLIDEPLSMAFGMTEVIVAVCKLIRVIFNSHEIDGINDKDYVDDYIRLWRVALVQKTTLVCFREGSDEIVGLNVLTVNTKDDTFLTEIAHQVLYSRSFS